MSERLSAASLESALELWNAFYPAKYRIDYAALSRRTLEHPLFDASLSIFDGKTLVLVKRSQTPQVFAEGDADQWHLSAVAWTDRGAAEKAIASTLDRIASLGGTSVLFGQEVGHLFPGVPEECDELQSLLEGLGFEKEGWAVDFERDLADFDPKPGSLEPLKEHNAEVRRFRREELPELTTFLKREFPGRWLHDVTHQIAIEKRPGLVFGLFVEGQVQGFALTQAAGCVEPIGGAVWHRDLGGDWCALGPIGVSQTQRGKGFGDSLLAGALLGLKAAGGRRCIIDWTTLERYYGGQGFEVARRYSTLRKAL